MEEGRGLKGGGGGGGGGRGGDEGPGRGGGNKLPSVRLRLLSAVAPPPTPPSVAEEERKRERERGVKRIQNWVVKIIFSLFSMGARRVVFPVSSRGVRGAPAPLRQVGRAVVGKSITTVFFHLRRKKVGD